MLAFPFINAAEISAMKRCLRAVGEVLRARKELWSAACLTSLLMCSKNSLPKAPYASRTRARKVAPSAAACPSYFLCLAVSAMARSWPGDRA